MVSTKLFNQNGLDIALFNAEGKLSLMEACFFVGKYCNRFYSGKRMDILQANKMPGNYGLGVFA
ncbi:hypothetical protein AMQ84_10510 [Paenibacillus riograndensis]|uniref:Uncharacterized protein n=1 Tax=Paenibacillus riograndensis TaxID=483937 RepID=A0A132U3L5_9BACL|nr:hypothetical protein AMQ84_10510 [Paenibacillus riograndensis]KWX85167.1 hypothetical protein AMQ83_26400 [Paenibacillus riograndensis]